MLWRLNGVAMVDLNQFLNQPDPTLLAIDQALVDEQDVWSSNNIGFGMIGEPCSRSIWYSINLNKPEWHSADKLRIFRNGHREEAMMADDLRKVPGIELHTHDPARDNKQYKMEDLNGRFQGRLDGLIRGLIQAPAYFHTWEAKCQEDKYFNKIEKLKTQYNDNDALHKYNPKYYAQVQCGIKYANLQLKQFAPITRGYMTICTPGLRRVTSLRIEYKKAFADAMTDKAARIISSKEPMERISNDPENFQCRLCRHREVCHGKN